MTLTQILLSIQARWRLVAGVFVLVFITLLALLASQPKQYKAQASVMLDVKSADPVDGDVIPALGVASYMATQVDLLRSERVLRRALTLLRAHESESTVQRWQEETGGQGDMLTWLSEVTLRRLEVQPSRESNVISFAYAGATPQVAAEVTQAITKAYIDTNIEIRVDQAKQYTNLFDARAKQLREAVEAAQLKLSKAQQEGGVLVSDERLDFETARLADLSGQVLAAQVSAGESGARTDISRGSGVKMQEVLNSPLLSTLTAGLVAEEARVADLATRLGENHPDLAKARANVAQMKTRIAEETQRVVGGVAVTDRLASTKLAQLRTAYDAQRLRVAQLKTLRDQLSVLQRDVDNANQAYSQAVAKAAQIEFQSQARQSNVTVIRSATVPARAASPNLRNGLLLSVLGALLLGVVVALTFEWLDQRVRHETDVTVMLGRPLLGVLPDADRVAGGAGRMTALRADLMKRLGMGVA
ncbi:GNVR domain-containing protein [Aquabacterium sp. UBA2148]|uniref:GNVR domain-containing protein n=1 Tax=Aquabacterium sp. UBA2148 TaxID=1946042 RepID=UPI00257D2F4F|nr:GNVR domain-containing protein [Aquabacterium sp. UBA2148]